MREVRFFRTPKGHCPVEEFLDSLPGKCAQKVVWVLRLVQEIESVPAHYLKKLGGTDGLWEIRAQHHGDTFRILGFFAASEVLVLTNGLRKKSEKLPRRELDLAESRRRDYLKRRPRHE